MRIRLSFVFRKLCFNRQIYPANSVRNFFTFVAYLIVKQVLDGKGSNQIEKYIFTHSWKYIIRCIVSTESWISVLGGIFQ